MKRVVIFFLLLLGMTIIGVFKGTNYIVHTQEVFPTTATAIHNWFGDLGHPDTTTKLYHYQMSGRNYNWDTVLVRSYHILADTVSYDSTAHKWIVHYSIDFNTVDETYFWGFNRTMQQKNFYIDSLGNVSMTWQAKKDSAKILLWQVNKP